MGVGLVIVAATVASVMSGCFLPPGNPVIGGQRLISGWVYESSDFRVPAPTVGFLFTSADAVNRGNPEKPETCFLVDLKVDNRVTPEAAERIAALADADGNVKGAYVEFRAVTTWWNDNGETMTLTELIRLEAMPAGVHWARMKCALADDK